MAVPNFRNFTVIDISDRTLQLPLMNVINIMSTGVNFLFFFVLLVTDSKRKQSAVYRCVLLIQNGSLWLSQLHWGSLHGLVFLFPFPGLYGVGYLSNYISSFLLVIVWLVLFAITVLMLFVVLIIRMRAISRRNGVFHFRDVSYALFVCFLALYIFIPIIFCWTSAYSSPTETASFVTTLYPNAIKVLQIPGVFIYTEPHKFQRILVVALLLILSGGFLYVILCQIIVYEIRQNCRVWSEKVMKYHRKALKDTLIQNAILGIFLAIAPLIQIMNAYKEPEADTIMVTMLANATFVASPIPYTLSMLFQNTSYRQYLLSYFRRRKTPITSSIQPNHIALAVPRSIHSQVNSTVM